MPKEIKLRSYIEDISELGVDESFLIAASRGVENKIIEILDRKQHPNFNPNITDDRGFTALHLACIRGFASIVDVLLRDPRVNVNALDKLARHSIQLAWKSGNINIAAVVLNAMVGKLSFEQSEITTEVFLKMLFSSRADILGTCQDISKLDEYKTSQSFLNIDIISSLNSKDETGN